MEDWKLLHWGDLTTLEYGKALRGYKNTEAPYPVYGTNGQIGFHKDFLSPSEGVVIGRKGAYRGVHYSREPFFVIDTAFYLRPKPKCRFNLRWAYCQLKDFDINNIDSGTAIPSTSRDAFYQIPVKVPPLPTQHRIVAILSAYDDMIENNTRRISILEEMARRLYEEWFVRFRFPGHDRVKMVDREVGPLPEGWEEKRLDEYGSVITGKTPSKKRPEFYGGDVSFLKLPDMHENMFAIDTADKLTDAGAASQANKTIPENSLCVSCIGTAGIVNITTKPCQTNQQINSIVLNDQNDRELLYFVLMGLRETINLHGATGATMTNLSRGKFSALTVCHPVSIVRDLYHEKAFPMFELMLTLQRKNANLRTQRDLLLPKLISGEIDVSGIGERMTEAAAE